MPKGDTFYQHLYWSSDEAKALFTYIATDRALPVVTTSGTSVGNITVPPSQVSVRVLNGTSTDNLAHQVGDELISAGFKVVSVGSAAIVPVAKTSIIYRADLERFREVTLFLLKDCCGGRPDICAPLIADLTPCCPAKVSAHD